MDIVKFSIGSYIVNLSILMMVLMSQASTTDLMSTDENNPFMNTLLENLGAGENQPESISEEEARDWIGGGGSEETSLLEDIAGAILGIRDALGRIAVVLGIVFVPMFMVSGILVFSNSFIAFIAGAMVFLWQILIAYLIIKFILHKRVGKKK